MDSIVKYRIPGKSAIELSGSFVELDDPDSFNGFLFSTFNSTRVFGFSETKQAIIPFLREQKTIIDDQSTYEKKGREVLEAIKEKKLEKLVLSRIKEVESDKSLDGVFHSLCIKHPEAFVYMISDDVVGSWIGATPEVLLKEKNGIASTMALAGTLSVEGGQEWTSKEFVEQELVEQSIASSLQDLNIPCFKSKVYEKKAGTIRHLCTDFEFNLEGMSVFDVAFKLSPTPAVSGFPKLDSCKLIEKVESHDRSLYTGFVGVKELNETNLFVNLRCARKSKNQYHIFVGGGYTIDSEVEKEWNETENKSKTILNALNS